MSKRTQMHLKLYSVGERLEQTWETLYLQSGIWSCLLISIATLTFTQLSTLTHPICFHLDELFTIE